MVVALQVQTPDHHRPGGAVVSLTVPEVARGLGIPRRRRALMEAASLGSGGPGSPRSGPFAVLGFPADGS